ncbi:MAG: Uma2 family endonuclease [Gemmataceae bacterium]
MSAVQKQTYTPEEYLRRERTAAFKSEFLHGEIFAMAGTSYEHVCINENLSGLLWNSLRGSGCRSLSQDLRVKVTPTGLYTYPDLLILCGEPQFEDSQVDTLLNPSVIIEVLSPSTEGYDRGAKFHHYRTITSLKEYVLVSQTEMRLELYTRQNDDSWLIHYSSGADAKVQFRTVPVQFLLAAVYEGVTLSEAEPTPPGIKS